MVREAAIFLLLLSACAQGPSTDLVIYKPVLQVSGSGIRTRMLLVTGGGRVLGVERKLDGSVGVRVGTVASDSWEVLRTHLAGARLLPSDTTPPHAESPTFQIRARLGEIDFQLRRDPSEPLEKDVAAARDRLEIIWQETPETAHPVEDMKPSLGSYDPMVRGLAATALLKLYKRPETKAAAEKALRAHLEVEEDREIRHAIRDVIDQPR